MAAVLAWSQLDLFAPVPLALNARSASRWKMSDRERDCRTGGQWLRAVKAYLEFGAGTAWRRLSDPEQRNSPERNWYMGGIRTMNGIPARVDLVQDGRDGAANLPAGAGSKAAAAPRAPSSSVARLMASRSRGWIVDELLRVNPVLTDKKLLLRLSHLKLSDMLVTSRRGAKAGARPAAKKESPRLLPKQPKRAVPLQGFPAAALRGAA